MSTSTKQVSAAAGLESHTNQRCTGVSMLNAPQSPLACAMVPSSSKSNTVPAAGSPTRSNDWTVASSNMDSVLPSPPKSPKAKKAADETPKYQEVVSAPTAISLSPLTPIRSQEVLTQQASTPTRKLCRRSGTKTSPYFPKSSTSCIPFPSLSAKSFGLIQEKLSHDPYRLLIAVIFLNKTKGEVAVPVFWRVMERYATPGDLAAADEAELVEMIGQLGLQNQRAAKCINLSKKWVEQIPTKGVRYRRLHYPNKDDGKDIQPHGPPIGDEDARSAWEIAHLPGVGPYAIDSWRIFCRDVLRGLASDWNGQGATSLSFEPEWRSVLPQDKELRAFLRWMWLRNGWEWDPLTGHRKLASEEILQRAIKGGTAHERGDGNWDLKDSDRGEEVETGRNQPRGGESEQSGAICLHAAWVQHGEAVRTM